MTEAFNELRGTISKLQSPFKIETENNLVEKSLIQVENAGSDMQVQILS